MKKIAIHTGYTSNCRADIYTMQKWAEPKQIIKLFFFFETAQANNRNKMLRLYWNQNVWETTMATTINKPTTQTRN
jgi:hypothetical protein